MTEGEPAEQTGAAQAVGKTQDPGWSSMTGLETLRWLKDHDSDPSRANLVCWPFGAGGGEDLAGGAGQRVGGDVGVTGDDDGDLLQRA